MFFNVSGKVDTQIKALISSNDDTLEVLSKLADELKAKESELCCYQMLNHPKWKEILEGVFKLLKSNDKRFLGNAAFVIGSLCELDACRCRIIQWLISVADETKSIVLQSFNKMFKWNDKQVVINSLGTIATLAESAEGRLWLLRLGEFDETIELVCNLLKTKSKTISNNSSLIIARVSVVEEGCARILNHPRCSDYLLRFIVALRSTVKECRQNMAFTLAQLLNLESGQRNLLSLPQSEDMIEQLVNMMSSDNNTKSRRDSCFALGALASKEKGNTRVLTHNAKDRMLLGVAQLLNESESELVTFALLLLKSMISFKRGCILLRDSKMFKKSLIETSESELLSKEHLKELKYVLSMIEDLPKPLPPEVEVVSATSVCIKWDSFTPKSNLELFYHIFKDGTEVSSACKETEFLLDTLTPNVRYSFTIQFTCEGATSPSSESTAIKTPEAAPSCPTNFCMVSHTTSHIKVYWDEPLHPNGVIRGYELAFLSKTIPLKTTNYLITNLQAGTHYDLKICALTSQGRGPPAHLDASTEGLSAFAPPCPTVRIHGRTELAVEWNPPKRPLGRLNYYELTVNKQTLYRGVERTYTMHGVNPSKEYTFTVSAWTSEGRCESSPTKIKVSRHTGKVPITVKEGLPTNLRPTKQLLLPQNKR